jgi:diaminohydroxyphosphoribosylaminopyrimidine deaminase/5-amino-6-(5-phosphoribosylamino)uracil reductase
MLHKPYMQQCLLLAQKGKGSTNPNPMVGAVLVHHDRIIGEGWHHYYGMPHAEVNCIDNVSTADKHLIPDSTMYVSLEPCAHHGLTPPCANRIVQEGIKKVVIANTDPFAKVNGRGIAILESAGIDVTTGIMEEEGWWVNRRFFCYHTRKRPYIILKWAQTADGYVGMPDRTSVRITGAESQQLSHKWRTEEAAIMVGYMTALNDNPHLTARHYKGKQPLRIALDRNKNLPHSHNLFNTEAPTWLINEHDETVMGNVHYINLRFDNLIPQLLDRLHEAKILSIIIEGGPELQNSLIEAGLWDEARIFTGSMVLGAGVPAPVLRNEIHAFDQPSGDDNLQVYTNINNGYAYMQGMEL